MQLYLNSRSDPSIPGVVPKVTFRAAPGGGGKELFQIGDKWGRVLPPMGKPKSPNSSYYSEFDGGRYRIRTYDFHRVKMALYR